MQRTGCWTHYHWDEYGSSTVQPTHAVGGDPNCSRDIDNISPYAPPNGSGVFTFNVSNDAYKERLGALVRRYCLMLVIITGARMVASRSILIMEEIGWLALSIIIPQITPDEHRRLA